MKSTTRSLYCAPYGINRSSPEITTPSLCALAVFLFPRIGPQTQRLIVKLLNFVSRFGLRTVLKPGLRVTGHRDKDFGRVGSGHGSVWQIQCQAHFYSFYHTLCCFFCGENTPFSVLNSKHRHSVTGSCHRVKSVWVGSDHGSKVQTLFDLWVRILNVFIELQNAKACIAIYCCSVSVCCMCIMFHTPHVV